MFHMDFYKEERIDGDPYRRAYMESVEAYLDDLCQKKNDLRKAHGEWSLSHPEMARAEFREMLGAPLTQTFSGVPAAQKTLIASGNGVSVYRMQIQVLEGIPLYGLLFLKDGSKRLPLVIAQHGGEGSPELASDLYAGGSVNYNHMVERILAYDVNVFAPQLLLWDPKLYPIVSKRFFKHPHDQRQDFDSAFKQMGGSMAAFELTCLTRCLDYLEAQPYVDPTRIGMIGLSYGGFYTLFLTALDKRIRSAICSCYFCSKEQSDWYDFVFPNAAERFLDAEVALLVHPRHLCIESGRSDPIFTFDHAEKEIDRLSAYFGGKLPENITYLPFDGEHEFSPDDTPIRALVDDLYRDTQ